MSGAIPLLPLYVSMVCNWFYRYMANLLNISPCCTRFIIYLLDWRQLVDAAVCATLCVQLNCVDSDVFGFAGSYTILYTL
jgi:hypothetical protein